MAEVIVFESPEAAASHVAALLADQIENDPATVLGLATGSTPGRVYEGLARLVRDRSIAVDAVSGFALDEYVGLEPGHPESYRAVIDREVVRPLGLDPDRIHLPPVADGGSPESCRVFEDRIARAGGVDVQILGIGTDGHIGFNEPGSSLGSRTRLKTLTARTRRDNARFFASEDEVPVHCVTQGIGTILEARHLVLLAFGEAKAAAVAAAVEGPLSASVPGSAIQLHPRVTVVLDDAAAAELRHREYYDFAWANRPR
ncbi:glucosamine-6-phosphate deaminase [Agromyces atrinae]|uniref:glucosamine-6-phosphate deaminase n=1 Tax=Agromyces atrinae TaxID=592376 RepID=UPI001F5ADAD7|nr:glucosamine-6-phosphate deaminase [Agromyces atrinae]MCI2959447.1 glucosamine-6-phosphate deaminase [Agromyces atrinae]